MFSFELLIMTITHVYLGVLNLRHYYPNGIHKKTSTYFLHPNINAKETLKWGIKSYVPIRKKFKTNPWKNFNNQLYLWTIGDMVKVWIQKSQNRACASHPPPLHNPLNCHIGAINDVRNNIPNFFGVDKEHVILKCTGTN